MPTITIDKNAFEELVGKKLPLDELKDRISMLGTDLESIEGNDIHVEVFPNRPDMLSVQGFARAFSSFIGQKTGLREYKVNKSDYEVIVEKSVEKVRPFTVCAVVKGIKYDDRKIKEVIMVQEKLHVTYGRNRKKVAIGIYPMEKISFPIIFRAEKPSYIVFQPLDYHEKLTARQILLMHPTGKEYAHLLANAEVYPIFVDGKGEILSMPPIINSHDTGKISYDTKDVFIECSGFDIEVLKKSLNMIVCAMAEMGGDIYSMRIRYPEKTVITPDLSPEEMAVDRGYIEERLGITLSEKELKRYLEQMGYGYANGKALVPAYRADILHQIDLAEDIAIAYGYERFDSLLPNVATTGEENPFEVFKNKLADALCGLGFLEAHTYNLTNREFQFVRMNHTAEHVALANSISQEYDILRTWVMPSMLEVLSRNKHHEYPHNLFGIGTTFKKGESETGVIESDCVAVVLCSDSADYTKARQALDYIMRCFAVDYTVEDSEHSSFIPGRLARVHVKGKEVAYIGEISPEVISNWQLEMPVAGFELNLTDLFSLIRE